LQTKLKILIQLQQVDSRLKELEELKGDLPGKVESVRRELEQLNATLQEKEEALATAKLERKKATGDMTVAQEKLKKFQDQLYSVKTNREYDAITVEIETVKSQIDQCELRQLELDELIENLKQEIKQVETEVNDLKMNLAELEKELQEKMAVTETETHELEVERHRLISQIEKPMYATYERIRKAKNGLAVVPIIRGACGGCYQTIPPQRILELRQWKRLIVCEVCGRILVWDETLDRQETSDQKRTK